MSSGAGKGPKPRPVSFKKKDQCPLLKKIGSGSLKPGEKFKKVYSK